MPFVARALRGRPVALLLTFRPEDEAGGDALAAMRAELRRDRLAEELALEPLAPEAAAAMLAEVLGREPAAEVRAELLRLAGGNPFALEELARAAVDSGWLDPATGRRRGTGAVELPWTLADSIRARAARLAPREREMIAWAAAIGERFDVRLLARASGAATEEVLQVMARLVAAGMIVEPSRDVPHQRLAFRHALVHEALSQEGLAAQRQGRHARVLAAAEALAAEGMIELSPAELARQAIAAGDRPRALAHSRAAAADAEEIGAIEEAIAHLERALSLWAEPDGPELRAQLLVSCGWLRSRGSSGDARAVELLEFARDAHRGLGDEMGLAWCRALLAEATWLAGNRTTVFAEWEAAVEALRRAGAREHLRSALAAQARAVASVQGYDAGLQMAEEGLALVPEVTTVGEARDRISLLATVGLVRLWRCDGPGARAVLEEASRLGLEHHDDVGASRAYNQIATGNLLLTPLVEGVDRGRMAVELAARHGLHTMQAHYLACQTWLTTRAGAWEDTWRLIQEAEALLDPEDPSEYTRWILAEARADLALGEADLAGAEAARLALLERAFSVESDRFAGYALDGAAVARLLAGDPAGARDQLEPELARFLELIGQGAAEAEVLVPKVQVLVAAGDQEQARRLAAWGLGVLPDHPQIRYCAALPDLLDAPDVAAAEVEAAAVGTEAHGWTFVAACDRVLAAGIAAAADGGRSAAVALLRAARERFAGIGCEGWLRRVDESLRALGERAPTRAGAGAGGLSARELEVLGLVAEGLTNRQIAERLVISEHTAIRHVANVTRKLGVRNRAAAARVGAERGLIASDMASAPGHE